MTTVGLPNDPKVQWLKKEQSASKTQKVPRNLDHREVQDDLEPPSKDEKSGTRVQRSQTSANQSTHRRAKPTSRRSARGQGRAEKRKTKEPKSQRSKEAKSHDPLD